MFIVDNHGTVELHRNWMKAAREDFERYVADADTSTLLNPLVLPANGVVNRI